MKLAHEVFMQYSRPYRWIIGDTNTVRQHFFQDRVVSLDWAADDLEMYGADAPSGLKRALKHYWPNSNLPKSGQ